jgi:hypothetical protein
MAKSINSKGINVIMMVFQFEAALTIPVNNTILQKISD